MSISGFMKQINKANQLLSEKIGGAKGTDLDEEFNDMEKKTDVINRLVDDLQIKTNEFLQPNPASRAKLWTVNNLSKMRGQVKNTPYPQPEGLLGEAMIRYGKELGDESNFGGALNDVGEALRQMAGIKYALEDNIKQNFLDPLTQLKDNEIKEVLALRRKTENRRLDFDCKKRKKTNGSAVTEDDLRMAEDKFEESKSMTQQAMARVLSNELEQITHMAGFAEGFLEYHRQCYEILKDMSRQLNERKKRAMAMQSNLHQKYGVKANGSHRIQSNGMASGSGNGSIKSDTMSNYSGSGNTNSRLYDNGAESTTTATSLYGGGGQTSDPFQPPQYNGKQTPFSNEFSSTPSSIRQSSIQYPTAPPLVGFNYKNPTNSTTSNNKLSHSISSSSTSHSSHNFMPLMAAGGAGTIVSVPPPPSYQQISSSTPPPINQRTISNGSTGKSGREPLCRGLYDFEAENEEELDFKEGSNIKLLAKLDDNWLLGELNGRRGRFPVSYVEIVVPLP